MFWKTSVPVCNEASCNGSCSKTHLLCDCHPGCEALGSCCLDYEDICLKNKTSPKTDNITDLIIRRTRPIHDAILLPMNTTVKGEIITVSTTCYIGLSQCPTDYPTDSIIREKCEQDITSSGDIISKIPISTESEMYKNIYCAACHGLDIKTDTYYPWRLDYACNDNAAINSLLNQSNSLNYIDDSPPSCSPVYYMPRVNKTFGRKGCPKIIDYCPPNYKGDNANIHACYRYKDLVFTPKDIFKNRHCALCHGVDFSESECNGLDFGKVGEFADYNHFIMLPDFSKLMEFVQQINTVHGQSNANDDVAISTTVNDLYLPQLLDDQQPVVQIHIRPEYSHCNKQSLYDVFSEAFVNSFTLPNFQTEFNCSMTYFDNIHELDKENIPSFCINIKHDDKLFNTFPKMKFILSKIQTFAGKALKLIPCKPIITFDVYNHKIHTIDHCQTGAYVLHNISERVDKIFDDGEIFVNSGDIRYNSTSVPLKYREIVGLNGSIDIVKKEMSVKICEHILDNCTKQFIPDSKINALNNGKMYLSSYDIELKRDQFEFRNNGIIACYRDVDKVDFMSNYIKGVVSIVCISISLGSLLVTFCVYCLLKSLRTVPGKAIMNLVVALFLAHLIFELSNLPSNIEIACLIVGISQHYFFLVTFAWMSILAWNLCGTFTATTAASSKTTTVTFVRYFLTAWVAPSGVIVLCVCIDLFTTYDVGYGASAGLCWLRGPTSVLYFIVVPLVASFCLNGYLFGRTVVAIRRMTKDGERARSSRSSRTCPELAVYMKIASLMGFTWVFGFLSGSLPHDAFDYLFIILNGLQGFYILLAFVLQKSVLKLIRRMYFGIERKSQTTSKTDI